MTSTVFVTGGTGQTGANVCEQLIHRAGAEASDDGLRLLIPWLRELGRLDAA